MHFRQHCMCGCHGTLASNADSRRSEFLCLVELLLLVQGVKY